MVEGLRVAVVGQGVAGLSTALALREQFSKIPVGFQNITIIGNQPFEETCSYGPAGLFRIHSLADRNLAKVSFARFALLHRTHRGDETGVKLVSGYIESDDKEFLESQEKAYGDFVYGFRWLSREEVQATWSSTAKYCIFFTAYASEGCLYVPFLRRQLEAIGKVAFESRKLKSLNELSPEFDVVINCAGLNGGLLSGDDDTVVPCRGVALLVDAPWHKHFYYRDTDCFTIPTGNGAVIGTLRGYGESNLEVTPEERNFLLDQYCQLQPAMRGQYAIGNPRQWKKILRMIPPKIRAHFYATLLLGGVVLLAYGTYRTGITLNRWINSDPRRQHEEMYDYLRQKELEAIRKQRNIESTMSKH